MLLTRSGDYWGGTAEVLFQIRPGVGNSSLKDLITEWQVLAGLPLGGVLLEPRDNSQTFPGLCILEWQKQSDCFRRSIILHWEANERLKNILIKIKNLALRAGECRVFLEDRGNNFVFWLGSACHSFTQCIFIKCQLRTKLGMLWWARSPQSRGATDR